MHPYGSAPVQHGELKIPAVEGERPVVVLIHGGFWSNSYGSDLMQPLAADLNERGFATWNIEYRRIGDDGGGYPNTLSDVAAAIRALADVPHSERLDLDRISVIGHSSGGHLALWAAGQDLGSVTPALTIGLAPVVDLVAAHDANLGGGAARRLLGGRPDEVADAYEAAEPDLARAVGGVIIIHGLVDNIVPVSQSRSAEGSDATVLLLPDADHFDLIDPAHPAWESVVLALSSP